MYAVGNAREDYQMESTSQYVTKREFYRISINILLIVMYAMSVSDREGFWKLSGYLWALGFLIYCSEKRRSAKINSQRSDINQN